MAAVNNNAPVTLDADAKSPQVLKLLRQAREAMRQGHPGVAVIYLKNAESAAPNSPTVRLELGAALLASGNATDAERELRAARKLGAAADKVLPLLFQTMLSRREAKQLLMQFPEPAPEDHSALAATTLRARAYALAQEGNTKEAEAAADRALGMARTVDNLMARAQIAHDVGDMDLAMKMTDEALSKDPNNSSALVMKATLLQLKNQPKQALVYADKLVKEAPKSPMALLTRAGVLLQLNENAKALTDIDATLAVAPNAEQATYYKAIITARKKDANGAWALAQTLTPGFVNSRPDIGIAVSQMAVDAGHRELGANILSSTVINFPNNEDARVRLAVDYLQLDDPEHAIKTLDPLKGSSDPRALALLGQAYAKQGKYAASLDYFEKANAGGFGGDKLKLQIATSNLRFGNLSKAIAEFRELNKKQPGNPGIAGPLFAALLRNGDDQAAYNVASQLAKTAPESPYGPLYEGQYLAQKGDIDGAIAAFSEAVKRDPKFIPAKFNRALARVSRGDMQQADEDLQAVLAAEPKNTTAIIKLAQIAAATGNEAKVLPLLKRAVAADPKDPTANLQLANYYATHRNMKAADDAVSTFLRASPKNPSAIAMQGNIAMATGATDKAIGIFRGLAKAHPHSAQVQMLLATALARKGDVTGATTAYQDAIKLAPTLPAARLALIRYALGTKNEAMALSEARDFAAQEPGPASADILAQTLVALKKFDEAEKVLRESQAKAPNNGTLISLTRVLRLKGELRKADGVLTAHLAKNPHDAMIRLAYADALLRTDTAKAEQQFQLALKDHPYNLAALNNIAWLLREKNPKEALAYAERAQKIAPLSPAVLDTLGWIKWQLKDHAAGLALVKRAYAGNPNDPEVAYHFAAALSGSGDTAQAKKILDELLAKKINFEDRKKAEALHASLK